ncbi:BTB/POZ domain-containing protein At1g30440 isoform X2 [Daucus carota subsp. sativus]
MEKLIAEASGEEEDGCVINLPDILGGAKTFELVAKFCYGVKIELNAANVVYLQIAAEQLEMTEDYGEGNLVSQTELYLEKVVLQNWQDSLRALQECNGVLPHAEVLSTTTRLIESLALKASMDPSLFGRPVVEDGRPLQSPGGSVLWNGINTGAKLKNASSDWWYEDISNLSLPLYKRFISAMESRGIKQEIIGGSLTSYAKKYLPGLNRRQITDDSNSHIGSVSSGTILSEEDQKLLLEELDHLFPTQKGLISTKILFGLLRTAMILRARPTCISNLERRIGMQLDQATLEDLLMPNFSYTMETLYNVECVHRILEHFLAMDQARGGASPGSVDDVHLIGSPSLIPITVVAKLIDGYLAEVAPDNNLKLPKFKALAAAVPDYARPLDDGLYRAIDIYLKAHSWLADADKEELCMLIDCQKLSLEACTHAALNERLPLRIIVQVLFFEQLQLRTSVASSYLVTDNFDGSQQLGSGLLASSDGGWDTAVRENQVLKVGMDSMRMHVSELEKECSNMRHQIERLSMGKGTSTWGSLSKKLGLKMKSQMCSAEEGAISKQKHKVDKTKDRHAKYNKTNH